jgi:hypothetical protein
MGIFDVFKKKEDKSGFDDLPPIDSLGQPPEDLGLGTTSPRTPGQVQGFEHEPAPPPGYQPPVYPRPGEQQPQQQTSSRDTELILSKLDAIRSALTNIDIRISHLEKIAGVEQKDDKGYRW